MRTMIFRLLALVFGLLFALAVAEIGLRVVGYAGEHGRRNTTYDPQFGTVLWNSWMFKFDIEPGQEEIKIHGRRVPVEKPEDETRVLFIGDSATEGAFVPQNETFPIQFEKIMSHEQPEAGVRSINAGVIGMTTIGELNFFESKLLALHPDVVVLGLFMCNDINFNLGHAEESDADSKQRIWIARVTKSSALAHFTYLKALGLNSRYRLLRAEDMDRIPWIPKEILLIDRYGLHMLHYHEGEVATYVKDSSPLIDHAFDVLRDALAKFAVLGEEHGFEFRVLIIPSPSAVAGELRILHAPDMLEKLAAKDIDITPDQLDTSLPTKRVLEICRELDIVCIDPTEAMKKIGMTVFFPEDEHPTVVGHRVLARALAERRDEVLP